MENITHLLNLINFLKKFNDESVDDLLTYYVQCCQQQGSNVELPKEYFGPSNICSHCGSLWTRVNHKNRLIPGKISSNVGKKIIEVAKNDGNLSKFRASLVRKILQNKMNKMLIKCSACSKNTKISCKKPIRPKSTSQANFNSTETQRSIKKKKRRSRDKSAGLNIPHSNSFSESLSEMSSPVANKYSSPLHREKKRNGKSMTPIDKLKKINKEKIGNIFKDENAKKRNSLTNFLKELY